MPAHDPRLDPASPLYDPQYAQAYAQLYSQQFAGPPTPTTPTTPTTPVTIPAATPTTTPITPGGKGGAPKSSATKPSTSVPAFGDPRLDPTSTQYDPTYAQTVATEEAQYFGSPDFNANADQAAELAESQYFGSPTFPTEANAAAGWIFIEGIGWVDPRVFVAGLGTAPVNTPDDPSYFGEGQYGPAFFNAIEAGYTEEEATSIATAIAAGGFSIPADPTGSGGSAPDLPTPEPFDQDAWMQTFANNRGFASWEEYQEWMEAYNAGEVPGWWEAPASGYVDPYDTAGTGTGFGYTPPPQYAGGGGYRGGGYSSGEGRTSRLVQTIRYLIPGA